MSGTDVTNEESEARLARVEAQLDFIASHPQLQLGRGWMRFLSISMVRDLLYIIGLPVAVMVAYQGFDREFLSAQQNRALEQKNIALERLDKLQDINAQIYQLQTAGSGKAAFAIIEAKRGLIARLTDTVYSAWVDQPEMLGRYDLNALAEALLVQGRTDNALAAASAVDVGSLGPIDQIDQKILNARILFAVGPAFDMEAARQQLRDAVPLMDQIERESQKLLMWEKLVVVRLSNEFWRNTDCDKLRPLAESLAEIQAENVAAGSYEDSFGAAITLQGVAEKCG